MPTQKSAKSAVQQPVTASSVPANDSEELALTIAPEVIAHHKQALQLGIQLQQDKARRNEYAARLFAAENAEHLAEQLRGLVAYLDATFFSVADDERNAVTSAFLNGVVLPAIDAYDAATPETLDDARNALVSHLMTLAAKMPASVKGDDVMSLVLAGYRHLLQGVRAVPMAYRHRTPADKLATIDAAIQRRLENQAKAKSRLSKLLALNPALRSH